MGDEYRPEVTIGVEGREYTVSGFDNEDEAREFVHNLDARSHRTVEVHGPY